MGWFTHLNKFKPGTYIKADECNSKLDDIDTSFHRLPDPYDGADGKGFDGPLRIAAPTKDYEAMPLSGIRDGSAFTGIDTGTANAYKISLGATAYTDGMTVRFDPAHDCTGASTIEIDSLGPVPALNANGLPLASGDLKHGIFSEFVYNGGSFYAVKMLAGDRAYIDASKSACVTSETNAATSETNAGNSADEAEQWAIGIPSEPSGGSSKYWANQSNIYAGYSPSLALGSIRNRIFEYVDYNHIKIKEGLQFHIKTTDIDRLFTVANDITVFVDMTSSGNAWAYLIVDHNYLPEDGIITDVSPFSCNSIHTPPVYSYSSNAWYYDQDRYIGIFPFDGADLKLNYFTMSSCDYVEFFGTETGGDLPFKADITTTAGVGFVQKVNMPNGVGSASVRYKGMLGNGTDGSLLSFNVSGFELTSTYFGPFSFIIENDSSSTLRLREYGEVNVNVNNNNAYYVAGVSFEKSANVITSVKCIKYDLNF